MDPARIPTPSGMRSRSRQFPSPVTPWATSTSAPITTVAAADQAKARRFNALNCALVMTKNKANSTTCP